VTREGPSPFAAMDSLVGTSDRGYWPIPWFRLGLKRSAVTSPGLGCPLLPVGGLLAGRGHLVSSNVAPIGEPSEVEPQKGSVSTAGE